VKLGKIGAAGAIGAVSGALSQDNDELVQWLAASPCGRLAAASLGSIGGTEAIRPLSRALLDEDELVRRLPALQVKRSAQRAVTTPPSLGPRESFGGPSPESSRPSGLDAAREVRKEVIIGRLAGGVAVVGDASSARGMGKALPDVEGDEMQRAQSMALACDPAASRPSPPRAASRRVVPMQLWELHKLEETASQVLAALTTGRYIQSFGEALLQNFRGWQGADAWAKSEEARIAAMVASDDLQCREELRRWVEQDVVTTLREVRKEVNRGRLAGEVAVAGDASSTRGTGRALADGEESDDDMQRAIAESLALAFEPERRAIEASMAEAEAARLAVSTARSDALEEASLMQAVAESLGDAERQVVEESPERTACVDERHRRAAQQAEFNRQPLVEKDGEAKSRLETQARQLCVDADVGACADADAGLNEALAEIKAAMPCGHACDVGKRCCACTRRFPGRETVGALNLWWRNRCMDVTVDPDTKPRFFCSTCARTAAQGRTKSCHFCHQVLSSDEGVLIRGRWWCGLVCLHLLDKCDGPKAPRRVPVPMGGVLVERPAEKTVPRRPSEVGQEVVLRAAALRTLAADAVLPRWREGSSGSAGQGAPSVGGDSGSNIGSWVVLEDDIAEEEQGEELCQSASGPSWVLVR